MFNNNSSQVNIQSACVEVAPGDTRGGPDGGAPSREGPPSGEALGSTYKIGIEKSSSRVLRYVLQQAAGDILPDERVHWCNRRTLPDREFVGISYSEQAKRAHYNNLMRCCQIWICPVCAQKVIFERKKEIQTGIANYKAAGGHAYMLTFTLQHSYEDPLQRVLEDLLAAVRGVFTSFWWDAVKKELQIQAMITALEGRWGMNGWHPHKHPLLLCKNELSYANQVILADELTKRYCDQLKRRGAYADQEHAVVLTEDTQDGGYLTKWGIEDELTKGAMKPGRSNKSMSPFDLLTWSLTGKAKPRELYKEYWENFKGHRQLVFHKGTRKILGLSPAEQPDAELLELAPADDVLIYQIALDVWKRVCSKKLRGQLLDVAENSGLAGVEDYLRGLYE